MMLALLRRNVSSIGRCLMFCICYGRQGGGLLSVGECLGGLVGWIGWGRFCGNEGLGIGGCS